jgi:peptidyl-prolyl cis-trans isomerase C
MGDSDDFKRKAAYARTKLLMEQLLQTGRGRGERSRDAQGLWRAIGQMKKKPEVRAPYLVETEDEAKQCWPAKKGMDFAELAKTKSKDPARRTAATRLFHQGPDGAGVLEKCVRWRRVRCRSVKSQFGWHVIKVEDKRERQPRN